MKRWWLAILVVLSLGMNLGILAIIVAGRAKAAGGAQQTPVLRPSDPDRLNQFADRLGLTGDVRKRFIERQRRFLADTEGPRRQLGDLRRAIRSELIKPKPDHARIERLLHDAGDVYTGLEDTLIDNVLDTRSMLPPDAERRYVDLISRLRLEGPGALGRLPPPFWRWWQGRWPAAAGQAAPANPDGPPAAPPP